MPYAVNIIVVTLYRKVILSFIKNTSKYCNFGTKIVTINLVMKTCRSTYSSNNLIRH